jgi:hypothetical protein
MLSIKRAASERTDARRRKKKSDYDIDDMVEKELAARKIKQTKARLAKRRSIMVPGRFDIRCELDKFYEEVNAMQQQFGQQQHPQHQQFGQQQQSTNTFGLGGGRRKRRSSKLKRRSRRSSKLKRRNN